MLSCFIIASTTALSSCTDKCHSPNARFKLRMNFGTIAISAETPRRPAEHSLQVVPDSVCSAHTYRPIAVRTRVPRTTKLPSIAFVLLSSHEAASASRGKTRVRPKKY